MFNLNNQTAGFLTKILQSFSGPITSTAFSLPSANGINGVPPQLTFQNFLSNLQSSVNTKPEFLFPTVPGTGPMPNSQAANAYRNTQNQFIGGLPFMPQNISPKRKTKALLPIALAPGSSAIISASTLPTNEIPQQGISPIQALVGSQLQGFGLQQGSTSFNGSPFPLSAPTGVQLPQATFPQTQPGGIASILSTLVFPVMSLFSAFKSLFNLKGLLNGLMPTKVNLNNLEYKQFQGYLTDIESEEGSFDDYEHYLRAEGNLVDDNVALSSKLGEF